MILKHLKTLIAPILVALLVAGGANAAFYNRSKTPASNATADATINWSEGMSPSSVNDSARALMARTAEWRDDISGALTTTGTGTALVVATNQVFTTTALMNNAMIAFVPNVTNTGAVTLAVDGLTAKPIRSATGTAGNLGAGVLVIGTPYVVTYKDAAGEFILQGFVGNPYAVPLGSFLFHSAASVPNSNFVLPIGQAISRTTYAAYFALVSTTFGAGDGTTTFNVPDLRSRMLLPMATMGGADPGRVTTAGSGINGAVIGSAGGAETVTLAAGQIPQVSFNGTTGGPNVGATGEAGLSSTSVDATSGATLVFDWSNRVAVTTYFEAHTHIFSGTVGSASPTAVNKMPPTFVLGVILRIF